MDQEAAQAIQEAARVARPHTTPAENRRLALLALDLASRAIWEGEIEAARELLDDARGYLEKGR